MKKLIQGALLPFAIFSASLLLFGCEQASNMLQNEHENQGKTDSITNQNDQAETELQSGNLLYITRDVAEMQLKAGHSIQELTQTQVDLQQAIDVKNTQQLQQIANTLDNQLKQLDGTLSVLDLKSQEIDSIRHNLRHTTQQALASPFLKDQVDLSKVDPRQIKQQIDNIQGEMVKLAAMMIPQRQDKQDQ